MICKVNRNYVVAVDGLWMPGIYDSETAAMFALEFRYEELFRINEEFIKRQGLNAINIDILKSCKNDHDYSRPY